MPKPEPYASSAALSYQNAPPFSVPVRFFLTAPLFAMAAAVLVAGAADFPLTRWQPAVIAATHFLVLGFMASIMVGALFQMIPVLCGGVLPRSRLTAGVVHTGLCAGTLLFPIGLLSGQPWMIHAGAGVLGAGLLLFLLVALRALHLAPGRGPSVTCIRLSLVSLLFAFCLGVHAAAVRAGVPGVPVFANHANVHLAWGLIGWSGLLLMGVAYQVVPMFQVTPSYPGWVQRHLGKAIFAGLLLWSVQLFTPRPAYIALVAGMALAAALLVFACITLRLQSQRRRRVPDITLSFWRLAMGCIVVAVCAWLTRLLLPPESGITPALDAAMGILFIIGAMQSAICGMLYKIVPFLGWLHLQTAGIRGAKMYEFIDARGATSQFLLHCLSLPLLLAATAWPQAAIPATLAFGLNATLLQWNLLQATWRYAQRRRLDTGQRAPNSRHL